MKRQLSNQVNSHHARIILMSADGLPNRIIAQRADCSPQWVRLIIHRFNAGGIEALRWSPCGSDRTGRPYTFTAEIVEQIAEIGTKGVKLVRDGAETEVEELWSTPKVRFYHTTPVRVGDYVYGSSGEMGACFFVAVNAKTGESPGGSAVWPKPLRTTLTSFLKCL